MTNRHDLEQHRESLADIRNIMNSMKTLAYMESRKLARFLAAQQAVVRSIEDAATDLLAGYPDILPSPGPGRAVIVLAGTERGFCGGFNHNLLRHLGESQHRFQDQHPENRGSRPPILVSVGQKLHALLEEDPRLGATVSGAAVAEDIPALLHELADQLDALQTKHGALALFCLHHCNQNSVELRRLLPPFQKLAGAATALVDPPALNLSPAACLAELSEHYLFAALHEIFYTSLSAENLSRMTHLEDAVRKLDNAADDLQRRCNALRQEEIIEEIEVILLNASTTDDGRQKGLPPASG